VADTDTNYTADPEGGYSASGADPTISESVQPSSTPQASGVVTSGGNTPAQSSANGNDESALDEVAVFAAYVLDGVDHAFGGSSNLAAGLEVQADPSLSTMAAAGQDVLTPTIAAENQTLAELPGGAASTWGVEDYAALAVGLGLALFLVYAFSKGVGEGLGASA
jgi:hypothetical protein